MFILDASAILAVLLDEDGAQFVVDCLEAAEVSIINVCEVLTKTVEEGGDPERVQAILNDWGVRVRAFGEGHAIANARLRSATKHLGLGFGDRAVIVQGGVSMRPVLTADRKWSELDLDIEIVQIR